MILIVTPPIFPRAPADASQAGQATNGVPFDQALQTARRASAAQPVASPVAISPAVLYEIGRQEKTRRDREARRRGGALLDALTHLQRACLTGRPAAPDLEHLSRLLISIPVADDPRLAEIVRAIAVRATVELCQSQPV